jgi:hypothetical protein
MLPQYDGLLSYLEPTPYIDSEGITEAQPRSENQTETAVTSITPRKRKSFHEDGERHYSNSLHHKLFSMEIQKMIDLPYSSRTELRALLDHAQMSQLSTDPSQVLQLRFMYLAIGSCQSLIDFKEQLRVARNMMDASNQPIGLNLSVSERFMEICRLDDEEAVCVLLRRYHMVKLCEDERNTFLQKDRMIVETPETFGIGNRAPKGSPTVLREAALTDALLFAERLNE